MTDKTSIDNAGLERKRRWIFELIDASAQLAAKLGPHPLAGGCACIACANKRKRMIWGHKSKRIYRI